MSDLLAAESLMDEEDTMSRCCEGRLSSNDLDPFASLLHIVDHCLYRIVRWARNRPDFASISVIPAFTFIFGILALTSQLEHLRSRGLDFILPSYQRSLQEIFCHALSV